jgi:hypothetical protein
VFDGLKPWECTRISGGSGWRQGSCGRVLYEAVKPDAQPPIYVYKPLSFEARFLGSKLTFTLHVGWGCCLNKYFKEKLQDGFFLFVLIIEKPFISYE